MKEKMIQKALNRIETRLLQYKLNNIYNKLLANENFVPENLRCKNQIPL